jgi:hypothetical protein
VLKTVRIVQYRHDNVQCNLLLITTVANSAATVSRCPPCRRLCVGSCWRQSAVADQETDGYVRIGVAQAIHLFISRAETAVEVVHGERDN